MSADVLRQAAALMRERAEVARAGRWATTESALTPDARLVVANWRSGPVRVATCSGSMPEGNVANAEHIASWHPAVALAVAAWIESVADRMEYPDAGFILGASDRDAALHVARAHLGSGA